MMQQQMRQMQHPKQQAKVHFRVVGTKQQLIMKGFDKIEVLSGGEEQWQNWFRKIKTAVSGMNEEFAETVTTAETDGIESIEEVL